MVIDRYSGKKLSKMNYWLKSFGSNNFLLTEMVWLSSSTGREPTFLGRASYYTVRNYAPLE